MGNGMLVEHMLQRTINIATTNSEGNAYNFYIYYYSCYFVC